jgi:uncharacterized membrane protein YraQ (UPF0718 family)
MGDDLMENKKNQKKKKKSNKSFYFMGMMVALYGILYLVDSGKITGAFKYSGGILLDVIPILIFVYVFMLGMSFVDEKKLKKYINKAPRLIKYTIMSLLGTLSHGPIYAWYPFLKDLNEKGISKGNIASFLYARGIKLTLLPMLIAFFDLKFAVILAVVTFFFGIVEGYIIDMTSKSKKQSEALKSTV